ncbi:MAG: patatin family protein [Firmicutes bacterium]|nr:patatin family protein [Clostridiales bacterium]MBQ9931647.1 patatin family protein [Bacillota bacterium]
MKVGVVIEGGGMRGVYTVGVLDALLDNGIKPEYVLGVSAGASACISYASGQQDRGKRIFVDYIEDKRYLSFRNFFRTKSFFGMDFLFREVPDHVDPLDYDTLCSSPVTYRVGVTNVETGQAEFFGTETMDHNCTLLAASSSMPILSPPVELMGKKYLDGGLAAPIPVEQALKEGCDRVIVIKSREYDYMKEGPSFAIPGAIFLRKYPKIREALKNRYQVYNRTIDRMRELEKEGIIKVVAPRDLPVGVFEKSSAKLAEVYDIGYKDGGLFFVSHRHEIAKWTR